MFIVMRKPVLMEDEGRHFFIKEFENREDAEQWIADQEEEFFHSGDYYVATVGDST